MTLTEYIKEVSEADFGKPFLHEAYWNKRLRSTGGRFFPKDGHLDFNPKILEEFGCDVFRKIVRHELCHYHLYYEKKGFNHKDQDFKQLLKAVDGLRYSPKSSNNHPKYHYQCCSCKKLYFRQRKLNLNKYVCGICHGKLKAVQNL